MAVRTQTISGPIGREKETIDTRPRKHVQVPLRSRRGLIDAVRRTGRQLKECSPPRRWPGMNWTVGMVIARSWHSGLRSARTGLS
jgi:hypothetical protein